MNAIDARPAGRRPLRVCIDARIHSGSGGVQQFVLGLASGLSRLDDGDEEYVFLAYEEHQDWLRPHVAPPSRIEVVPYLRGRRSMKEAMLRLGPVRSAWDRWSPLLGRRVVRVPHHDPTVERLDPAVVHLTSQFGPVLDRPTIYHPHDLQHLHYPALFTPHQRMKREVFYRTLCEHAAMIAVSSSFTRGDVIARYELPPEKVRVVPLAPPVLAYLQPSQAELEATRRKFSLPDRFGFYPAQTWPHKNHVRLLEALALLRDRHGVRIPMVFTGKLTGFYEEIARLADRLELTDDLRFLDFVDADEISRIYASATFVAIPSKFESASFPLWEAFTMRTPAAVSRLPWFEDQAGDAALQFDPDEPDEIATAMQRLWDDPGLRQTLVERGTARVAPFTWERTARTFRAHYRRLAGQSTTPEERRLIESPPPL